MKKIALTLLTLSGVLVLASCGKNNEGGTTNTTTTNKANFKEVAQTSALSSISMLNNTPTTKGLKRAQLSVEDKSLVLKQLDLVDELLKGDAVKSEESAVSADSKYAGQFDKYYTLTTTEVDGTKSVYEFYYKETLVAPETEEKPEEQKKANDQAQAEEQEVSSDLDGVVLVDGKEFVMHGDKEVSKSGQEVEVEFKFNITDDQGNYVVVKQEAETGGGENENEYKYSKYSKDKVLLEEVKIDFEQENGETEYSVESLVNNVKTVNKFKFEKEGEKETVKVTIIEGTNQPIIARLNVVDGKYVFAE